MYFSVIEPCSNKSPFVRFGAFSGRPHSTGPWYISINDLSRDVRFLQMWVICGGVTPGPTEPTTDQLVNVMEPTVREVTQLKEGFAFIFLSLIVTRDANDTVLQV